MILTPLQPGRPSLRRAAELCRGRRRILSLRLLPTQRRRTACRRLLQSSSLLT